MKKLLLFLLALPSIGFCDTKISALPSTTTLNSVDIIPVVTNPSTSPANKVISFQNLKASLVGGNSNAVQYNNGGSFAGASNLTNNGSTVTINGGLTISNNPGSDLTVDPVNNNTLVGHGISPALTGNTNTGMGSGALGAVTSANSNTAVGYQALGGLLTGSNNVSVGYGAGTGERGSNNTYIGTSAGGGLATLSYSGAIGAGSVVSSSHVIQMGGTDASAAIVNMSTMTVSSGTVSGNLTVSSLTVNNSNYFNKVAAFNSSGILVSTTVSSSGGVSSASGTVTASAQNNVAFYSVAGTSNVVNGSSNFTWDNVAGTLNINSADSSGTTFPFSTFGPSGDVVYVQMIGDGGFSGFTICISTLGVSNTCGTGVSGRTVVLGSSGGNNLQLNASLISEGTGNQTDILGNLKLAGITNTLLAANSSGLVISTNIYVSTSVWTGGNTFKSSTTFSGTVVISSGLISSGSAGTNGQLLTSGGPGTIPTWTTVSAGGPTLIATQTWSGQNNWTTPAQSTFTYGLTVGSLTISGTGAGAQQITEGTDASAFAPASGVDNLWGSSGSHTLVFNPNGSVSTYTVVGSSTNPTAGHLASWSGQGTLIDGGTSSSGGGTGSGTINLSQQYQVPFYSVSGSSNVLSSSANFTNNGSSVVFSNVAITTFTNVSTFTISSAYFDVSASTANVGIVLANGASGTNGQVLTSGGPGALTSWTTASGSGGGIVSPGTFTWTNTFGLSLSTVSVSSVSTLSGPVNVSSYTTITASGSINALKIVGNGVNGTTAGTSGAFLMDCTGGGSGSGMCGQVYSNAGAQGALDALWYLRAANTAWNEPLLYISNAASNAQSTIRMDSGWPTITMVDTTQVSPVGKFQTSDHLGVFRLAEVRNLSDNGFDSAIIVSSAASGNDVAIGQGYNSATSAQLQVITSSTNVNILTLSTSPTGVNLLAVSTIPATAPTDYLLRISSTSGTVTFGVQNNSHVISSGTTPSVSTCGTSPSMDGNSTDFAGTINTGSASPTACTLTFAAPFANTPVCIVSDDLQTAEPAVTSRSTTAITITLGAALNSGHLFYICVGQKG